MKKVSLLVVALLLLLSQAALAQDNGTIATDFEAGHQAEQWNMAGTPDDSTVRIENGQLLFEGAQDRSFFGPAGTYNEFALQFDLVSFEGGSTWIGVAFGLPQPDTFFGEPEAYLLYIVNDSLYLVRKGATEALDYADPIQRWIPAEYTLVMKEEPLNVKVVYGEGKLQVFYKLESEGEEAFAEPRAVFENLPEDITGHIQITTSGNDDVQGWFVVDNVKVSSDIHADLSNVVPAPAASEPEETPVVQEPAPEPPAAEQPAEEQPAASAPGAVPNPKTGDTAAWYGYGVMMFVALAVMVLLAVRMRRQQA